MTGHSLALMPHVYEVLGFIQLLILNLFHLNLQYSWSRSFNFLLSALCMTSHFSISLRLSLSNFTSSFLFHFSSWFSFFLHVFARFVLVELPSSTLGLHMQGSGMLRSTNMEITTTTITFRYHCTIFRLIILEIKVHGPTRRVLNGSWWVLRYICGHKSWLHCHGSSPCVQKAGSC